MTGLLVPRMAKTQPKGEGETGTRQIRVFEDVGEMISWIIRVEGGTTANLLDPMIRDQVTARYLKHEAAVEKLKAAEAALRKVEEEIKQQAKGGTKKGKRGEE